MKIKKLLFFVTLLVSSFTFSQDYIMGTDVGIQTTCAGTFYDSGGASSLYSADEDYTITFCPDLVTNPGAVIQIEFTQFDTEGAAGACTDVLSVWHANNNTGIVTSELCGNMGAGVPFIIQSVSPDGCITFQFTSNNTSQKIGWTGNISCFVPCTKPVANLVDDSTLDVCAPSANPAGNTNVSFDASPSTTEAGTNITFYDWVWGDGTSETTTTPNINHTYPGVGIYQMSFVVRNDNTSDSADGCVSTPKLKLIRILPAPIFTGTIATETGANAPGTTITIDCGDTVDLSGLVTSQTETQNPPSLNAGVTQLPDISSSTNPVSYESELDFTGLFPAGSLVTAGCYPVLNFDIEHTYSGDLIIELIAPSGEGVVVYNKHGGTTNFGACANPNDPAVGTPHDPGCTAPYVVVATGGVAWGAAAATIGAPPTANGTCAEYTGTCQTGQYYIAQTYTSTNPFTAFIGAQMNGIWKFKITDTLGVDNGVLTSWGINFPGSCYGDVETVTPDLIVSAVSGVWSHTGTGPTLPAQTPTSTVVTNPGPDGCPAGATCEGTEITNNLTVGPFSTGNETYVYTYTVIDEFGCQYEQDITINVSDNCTQCTLDLSSAVGTDAQNICDGAMIAPITYLAGNEVTNVTVVGLPVGVTGSYDTIASTFTIVGTPTVTGVFNYTVSTVGCLNTVVVDVQGTITVTDIPVANAVVDLRLCDTDNNGSESFDFTAQTVAVLNGQTGMTVSYYNSQVNADAGTATGLITSPYVNTTDPETIFIRVENDVNTTCFATTSFTIDIDPSPIANAVANPEMRLCDVGADGTEVYDLVAAFEAEVVGTQTNTTVTYYDGNNVVIATPNAYAGTLAQEIITIEVDYNDAANVCAVATTTVTIFLDAIPVANAVVDLRLCDTDNNGSESFDFTAQTVAVLNGQTGMTVSYYNSQVNADAGTATGLITSPYVNTTDPETIFIRVENDVNTTCFATTSFTIDIDPSPIANAVANPEMRLCDVGADGTEVYDLVAAFEAEVVGTQTNTTVTYYDGNNVVIATPNAYAGTLAQEIITIEVDYNDAANVCAVATTTVTIFLDAIPVANAVVDLRLCDTDNNGSESFDFTAQTVAVLNGQTGMTVSYYNSQVNADAGTATGLITSPYVNTTDPETIFIRVENDVNTTCFATTSFTIDIDPSPIANAVANPEMRLCDVGADGTEVYDLVAAFEAEVVGTQTNTTVTYYDGNNVVIATPNAYAGTLAQEIITIEVDYNDAANVCAVATTTVTIFLDAIPVANAVVDLRLCDTDNNGSESFDFTAQTVAVLNGQTGMTVSYYNSQVNADAGTATGLITSPYVNTTDPETIFIRVENDVNTTCFATTSFTIDIDPSPIANAVANPEMRLCDVGADGTEVYDLVAAFEAEVVGTQTNTTVTYYDGNNVVIATPNAYAGTLAQEIITIEVDYNDAANVCAVATTTVTIFLDAIPVANAVVDLRLCDTDNNGSESFDFTAQTVAVLNGQTGMTVSYYNSQVNADAGTATGLITSPYVNTTDPETIFIRVENDVNTTCFATTSFTIDIDPSPIANAVANPEMRLCDVGADGTEVYDLVAAFEAEVVGTQTNTTVTYYDGNNVVIATPNAYAGTLAQEIITIEVDYNDAANVCAVATTTVTIFLDAIPVAQQPVEMRQCDVAPFNEETFDLTAQNTVILGGLDPALFTISYYTVDVTNTQIAITDPTAYVVSLPLLSQEIFATVSNNGNSICDGTTSFYVFRDPIYNAAVAQDLLNLEACDDNSPGDLLEVFNLDALIPTILGSIVTTADATVTFYQNQADADVNNTANALTGTNALTSGTQTIHYTISNNDNVDCFSSDLFEIVVYPLPTLPLITNTVAYLYQECDTDLIDGLTVFDNFDDQTALIIGTNNYTVTYHLTQAFAQANTDVVTNGFMNTIPVNQPIGVRIEDPITGCVNTMELMLEVVTAPQGPLAPLPALTYCDTDNDGFGFFDLTTLETAVTSGISGVSVEFFETTGEADLGVGAINTSTLYQNIDTDGSGTGYTQVIYAQLTLDGFTSPLDCYTLVPITLLVIDSPELLSTDLVYKQCEEEPNITDGFVSFDLTSFEQSHLYTVILNNAGGDTSVLNQYSATYYTQVDASGNPVPGSIIPNPNAYENTSTPDQLIYVSVEHVGDATVVPSIPATGCSTIKAITLHVDLLPSTIYTPYVLCDDDSADGKLDFDLTLEPYYSHLIDGATDVSVDFYTTLAAADFGSTSAAEYIDTPTSYENEFNPQSVFARVYNSSTGCYAIEIMHLEVSPNPTPLSTIDIQDQLGNNGVMEECDGNVDGSGTISEQIATFDLTLWETQILNNESGVSAAYYTNIDEAEAGTSSITNPATYNNIANPQTIYVSVINDGSGIANASSTGCYTIVSFELYVPVPEVTITASKDVICVDANGVPLTNTDLPVLTANALPSAPYDYQWMLNGVTIPGATNQSLTVTESGDYTVSASGPTDFDCINVSAVVTIEVSGVPDGFNGNVTTTAFADSHQIVAEATSTIPGIEFWYSLDGAEATTDGTFDNVLPGTHIVTISDGENCWTEDVNVTIIDYPHFFTPNGDGVNDTWAIIGQEGIPISQIYIFDRFGKLLKQLDPDSEGWDGMYNGTQMPASDYWFKIMYIEGDDSTQKEFKAHFSLKR